MNLAMTFLMRFLTQPLKPHKMINGKPIYIIPIILLILVSRFIHILKLKLVFIVIAFNENRLVLIKAINIMFSKMSNQYLPFHKKLLSYLIIKLRSLSKPNFNYNSSTERFVRTPQAFAEEKCVREKPPQPLKLAYIYGSRQVDSY